MRVSALAMAGLAALVGPALIGPTDCAAAEGGIGHYLPGFHTFSAGVVPLKPGFYLRNDIIGYTSTAPRVVLNGVPVQNISADFVLEILQPAYVLPKKLFGATHEVVFTQIIPWTNLSGQIIGTDLKPSGARLGQGDIAISPFLLGWRKRTLSYSLDLTIFAPTGYYDIHSVANTGLNYWTFDLRFGATNLDPKSGWEVSGALGYSFNTRNPATDYTSGQVLHLDYAVGRQLKHGVKPGIAGYAWVQVTPDTGSGALFGSFMSRVYGVGPIVQWQVGENARLSFRYFHEFGESNRLVGDQFALSFRAAL